MLNARASHITIFIVDVVVVVIIISTIIIIVVVVVGAAIIIVSRFCHNFGAEVEMSHHHS